MAKTAKPKFDLNNLTAYRRQLGLNQQNFWQPLGVTQSGGSRYESGRTIPTPTAMLLVLRESGRLSEEDIKAAAAAVNKARKKS